MDGVTTALELEIGPPDVRKFLDQRRNAALINYGTTASHPWARAAIFGRPAVGDGEIVPPSGPATNDPATPEPVPEIEAPAPFDLTPTMDLVDSETASGNIVGETRTKSDDD